MIIKLDTPSFSIRNVIRILLLFCFSAPVGNAAGSLNPRWRWSSPLPFGNNVADLIGSTNAYYLAVADYGQIYQSADLTEWQNLETSTRRFLRAAVFHPLGGSTNSVVVVGEEGTVLHVGASGGVTNITVAPATTDWFEGIASSGSLLAAVGDNGAIYRSLDGLSWARQNSGVSNWLRSIAWQSNIGGGQFVVVGESGQILTSPDGITWTRRTSGVTTDLNRVATIGSSLIAVGNRGTVLLSSDGRRWSSSASGATDDLFAIAAETRQVLNQTVTVPLIAGARELRSAVRIGETYLWTDELDTRRTAPAPYSSYYAAVHDGNQYVVAGQAGLMIVGARTSGLGQPLEWSGYDSPPRVILRDITSGVGTGTNIAASIEQGRVIYNANTITNDFLIAAGYGPTLLRSDDSVSWFKSLIPQVATNTVLLGVGGRPNLLLAVGSGGRILRSAEAFEPLISTNVLTNAGVTISVLLTNQINLLGIVWTNIISGTSQDLQAVAANGQLFVVGGGSGTVLTSPDATTWTRRNTPSTKFVSSVVAGPYMWVAVGEGGLIWTSPDALDWSPRTSGTTQWLWRVRHTGNEYLVVGENGVILSSVNGLEWKAAPPITTQWLHDVATVDGTDYVVGALGTVLVRPLGGAWQRADTITGKALYGVTAVGGQIVAAGSEGVLLRARVGAFFGLPRILQWPNSASEQLFLIQGQIDQRLRLERSLNLVDWIGETEHEITSADGSLVIYSTSTNNASLQFFRAAERR